MAKKKQTQASQCMDPYSFSWEDAFYIHNLNDGTLFYRQGREDEEPWYNLCVKPNPYYSVGRHYCICCGSDYEGMLNTIKLYVSSFESPRDMYEMLKSVSNQGKLGKVMLGYADEWWENYSYESTSPYEDDIMEYIELGRRSKTYIGHNVRVRYTEEDEECSIEGRWAEWLGELVDRAMAFNGYTKKELYYHLQEYVDTDCLNEIFARLKEIGCHGIKPMKELNMYRWLDVLTPLVNGWDMDSSEEDETDNDEYE